MGAAGDSVNGGGRKICWVREWGDHGASQLTLRYSDTFQLNHSGSSHDLPWQLPLAPCRRAGQDVAEAASALEGCGRDRFGNSLPVQTSQRNWVGRSDGPGAHLVIVAELGGALVGAQAAVGGRQLMVQPWRDLVQLDGPPREVVPASLATDRCLATQTGSADVLSAIPAPRERPHARIVLER